MLQCSIAAKWTPWRPGRTPRISHAAPDPAPLLDMQPAEATVQSIRRAVQVVALPSPLRLRAPDLAPVDQEVSACWKLKREILELQKRRLQHIMPFRVIFRAFKLRMEDDRAHRQLRCALRARKRRRLLEMLEVAEKAAAAGDSKTLFGTLKLLCPARNIQRVKLRSPDGWLLIASDECRMLVEYTKQLFDGPGFRWSRISGLKVEAIANMDDGRCAFASGSQRNQGGQSGSSGAASNCHMEGT